ncbi:MAG: chorismate mutase [Bdellovibrionales bacterium]|nr:chorismate mutase [Bdellovibrionales bacterium]
MSTLIEIRKKLDAIDEKLIDLLNERADLAVEVRGIKQASDAETYAPGREQQILDSARERAAKGLFPPSSAESIMRTVLSSTRALVGDISVAASGPPFSQCHEAARKQFGDAVRVDSCTQISRVFEEVEHGNVDYGVVPVETAAEGLVLATFNMLMQSKLLIIAEIESLYSLNLVSNGAGLANIKRVFGDIDHLSLCRAWLGSNVPEAELVISSSPGEAINAASHEPFAAAVATEALSADDNMNILAKMISDDAGRTARMIVIGKNGSPPTGRDKTSLLCSVKERSGALMEVLGPFAQRSITLTKIESKAMRTRAWDYVFFIDLLGHAEDEDVKQALKALEPACSYLRVLGSYPAA